MSFLKLPAALQGWGIVFCGFLALSVAFSARAALGLVMPVWQTEFGWSSTDVSAVGAAALVVMAVVAPLAGRLVDKKGARFTLAVGLVFLGIGCLLVSSTSNWALFLIGFAGFGGIGFGIIATHVIATAIATSFKQNVGLATGAATSGSTGGQFLIVPLIAALLAFIDWRWSFGALGILSLCLLIPVLRLMPRPARQATAGTEAKKDVTGLGADLAYILKKPVYHALFWSFMICGFTTAGVIETHLLPFAAFCGFPPLPSATAYGVLSFVNLVGMIAAGWLADRVNRPLLLAAIYFLRAGTFILLGSLPGSSVEMLFVFAILFGAVDYATVPVTASLVASHIGLRVMGLSMGLISAGHAIGGALGAFLGGYLFDSTGSYSLLWFGCIWLTGAAALLVLLIPRTAPVHRGAQAVS